MEAQLAEPTVARRNPAARQLQQEVHMAEQNVHTAKQDVVLDFANHA